MIVKRRAFFVGIVLSLSFLGVLALLFAPLLDGGRNGLEYADETFNRLSKGSSYFIPKVAKAVEPMTGRHFSLNVRFGDEEMARRAAGMLTKSGVEVRREGARLAMSGDFGRLLAVILGDADAGYQNAGALLADRYGMPERTVLATWWLVLQQMDKALKQEKRFDEASMVLEVMKKGIEPAHNYYGIEAKRVRDMAGTMAALLLFYVLYTIWWGYAIYYLFEGIGLAMARRTTKR